MITLLLLCSCKQQQLAQQQTVYEYKTDTLKLYITDTIRIHEKDIVDITQVDTFIYVVDGKSGDTLKTEHTKEILHNTNTASDKETISNFNKIAIKKDETDSIKNEKVTTVEYKQNKFQSTFMWLGIISIIIIIIKLIIFIRNRFKILH